MAGGMSNHFDSGESIYMNLVSHLTVCDWCVIVMMAGTWCMLKWHIA